MDPPGVVGLRSFSNTGGGLASLSHLPWLGWVLGSSRLRSLSSVGWYSVTVLFPNMGLRVGTKSIPLSLSSLQSSPLLESSSVAEFIVVSSRE